MTNQEKPLYVVQVLGDDWVPGRNAYGDALIQSDLDYAREQAASLLPQLDSQFIRVVKYTFESVAVEPGAAFADADGDDE